MKRLFVLIAAAATIALPEMAGAQALAVVSSDPPFAAGEELVYNVSYRAALIPPINVMRVSIRTLDETLAGSRHFHIVGNGRTTGAAKGFFELNDTYHTWLDAATLLPSRMTSDIREDNYRFRATYTYDWNSKTVSNVRRNANWDADQRDTFPLPSHNSGDALSLFFRLRAIDPAILSPGKAYSLELVLDKDAKPITLRFIGREEVKIRKIGTFRALKFTCTMATSDGTSYEEGMSFTAWISDDANKIPLMVESPIRIGRVSVTLANGFRTAHALTSRIKN
ncbi:MAG: DUF3108 domain-containing protein [Alistipes sp.]|jgi:hypothetical protein|nr:DUF3108 domain-containing protein [Alistipes sp.]